MKFKTKGKSLLELRDEFGIGESGFYDNDWWLKEDFAKEKPEAGEYEIDFETKLTNLNYKEQKDKLKKDFDFPHPAVLAEVVLNHYKETGERLLEDWYSRTYILGSDDDRVFVGSFDSDGLSVNDYWGGRRGGVLGVSSSRKLNNFENRNLETIEDRILNLEEKIKKLEKFIKF